MLFFIALAILIAASFSIADDWDHSFSSAPSVYIENIVDVTPDSGKFTGVIDCNFSSSVTVDMTVGDENGDYYRLRDRITGGTGVITSTSTSYLQDSIVERCGISYVIGPPEDFGNGYVDYDLKFR